jgi:hypothetical protein
MANIPIGGHIPDTRDFPDIPDTPPSAAPLAWAGPVACCGIKRWSRLERKEIKKYTRIKEGSHMRPLEGASWEQAARIARTVSLTSRPKEVKL